MIYKKFLKKMAFPNRDEGKAMRFLCSPIEAVILREAVGDLPEEHTPLIACLRR